MGSLALRGSVVAALVLAIALVWGCATTGEQVVGQATDDGGAEGAPSDDGSPDVGTFGDATDRDGCTSYCESDLHAIVDCHGQVLLQCPPDQGCTPDGKCVPACDAAKANQSNIGCEYYAIYPYYAQTGQGPVDCYAAFVANTWTTPVKIAVEFDGQSLNVSDFARIPKGTGQSLAWDTLQNDEVPAGQVGVLFLSSGTYNLTKCPAPGANAQIADASKIGANYDASNPQGAVAGKKGFHVSTNAPVVAYDIYPFLYAGGAVTGASLLLPTSAWDTNYVAVAPWPFGANETPPKLMVIALEDNTTFTISPTAAIVGGSGIPATGKGVPQTYGPLAKGEWMQFEQDAELTGSPIQSNNPIGVWGASDAIDVPDGTVCCADSAHQQIPPVHALGHEYVAVRYRDRVDNVQESPPWRIVGAVDKTQLTYEPSTPQGAPASIGLGQVVAFDAPGPFVVRSQDDKHPFYLSAHQTGGAMASDHGDAEFVNVVPPDEYLSSYVLFSDPTYSDSSLTIVRVKAFDGSFKDVTLDCAGTLSNWQPVGDSAGRYQYTHVDFVRAGQPSGGCDNGRHEIKSAAPIGVTVWGWVNYSSYAYPAGMSARPINSVVVPPLPR